VTLKVSGFQLGVINALGLLAFPTMGLFVGVWIDRTKRRPVMIVANLVTVATLATIPLAYIEHLLNLYQLYLVALVTGICTLFFDVAYQSYLPSLVGREDVIEGNQKLQISASSSQVIGPTVASALMDLMGAALSIIADVIGTLVAAIALFSIRKSEPDPQRADPNQERHFFAEMKEGIKVVTGNSLLWTQAGCTATANFGSNIFSVALILYAYRILLFTPGNIGIPFSIGAAGFLVGVLISRRLTSSLGFGKSVALSAAMPFFELIALTAAGALKIEVLGIALFFGYLGVPIYNINQVSLRQIITPNRLQGRMNATMRTIVWGTSPVGSLVGGIVVTLFGITPTLIVGILISGGSILWIILGPIFKLKVQPEPVKE
jgi:Na+/melibiose symporter-like transporter